MDDLINPMFLAISHKLVMLSRNVTLDDSEKQAHCMINHLCVLYPK